MKKITFVILLFFISLTLSAQSSGFGVKAGLNLANLSNSDVDLTLDNKLGFCLGGFYEYALSEKLSIQPELLFSMQGGKDETTFPLTELVGEETVVVGEVKSSVDFSLNYLNIPVLLKYHPMENLFLELGPQLGITLSSKAEEEFNDGNVITSGSFEGFADTVDFGATTGVGYYFTSQIGVNTRYTLGLNKMEKNNGFKNRVLSLGLMYKF